jgi:hypothetical protein
MQSQEKRILAFDIGIKNLAWCCASSGPIGPKGPIGPIGPKAPVKILGWANENLVSGETAESDVAADKCSSCAKKAGFVFAPTGKGYCVRHAPPLTPVLRDLSGNVLKKIPAVAALKAIAERLGADKAALKTKKSVLEFLEAKVCFPKVKTVVKKVELSAIHDGMRAFIMKNNELFSGCTEILLENQPAYKNPVMKSVQMMLFATLRDLLKGPPPVRLVHAGRKTAGATGGDEGYAERKGMSEDRVIREFKGGLLASGPGPLGLAWFTAQKKRSDLADCLCMVLDCMGGVAAPDVFTSGPAGPDA